jgi:tetratricopeptide (TPR) repeat protein
MWWDEALSITKDDESFQTNVKKIIDHNKKLSKLDKDKLMLIVDSSSENQAETWSSQSVVPTRKEELTIAGLDWIKKGDDLVNSGKHKEAIKCYDKAIEMDPNDIHGVGVDALYRKGQVLSDTTSGRGLFVNNYDRYDAIECFKKIVALYPTYTNAWFSLARILEELGIKKNSKEIISCCDAIPETDPLFHYALTIKTRVFFELKRHEEAFECCDKALGNLTYYTGYSSMPDFALPMDGETSEDANKRLMFVLKLMVYSGKRLKKHDEKIRYKIDWCYEKILYLNPNDYEAQKYIKKRDSG